MKNKNLKKRFYFLATTLIFAFAVSISAQTTIFTYQGKLTDTGTPQSSYQMEFRLFGSVAGTDQIGGAITNPNVSVNQGVFTVQLDFGAPAFSGADRFLQISVRRSAAESFVTLNPRQQITSSPYSIRTLSAAQADVALDSQKLGGVDASQYVTTASVGNSFIKNAPATQQTGSFNISGNGTLGGTLQASQITAQTPNGPGPDLGLTQTNGAVIVGTKIGRITQTQYAGFIGTSSNHPLEFFANSSGPLMTINTDGSVAVGRAFSADTVGATKVTAQSLTGNYGLLHTDGTATVGSYVGVNSSGTLGGWLGTSSNHPLFFYANGGQPKMTLDTAGNVGIGTQTPNTRLTLSGGTPWTSAGWTASTNMQNASALGWEANASGQRFGIGQSTGGLYFFRTTSAFGNTSSPANYNMVITDTGNVTQPINNNGLVKAMIYVDPTLPASQYIVRCYNSVTNSSTGNCGFSVSRVGVGLYEIDFGFTVNNRFLSATSSNAFIYIAAYVNGANTVGVSAQDPYADTYFGGGKDGQFYLIIY
ncbi:MAG: hypothetical protein ACR2HG_14290 [Pyrinomonadaceae bacterium]